MPVARNVWQLCDFLFRLTSAFSHVNSGWHLVPGKLEPVNLMYTKLSSCFLIFLVLSTQVDDAWAVAPDQISNPVADEDDEFLAVDSPLEHMRWTARNKATPHRLKGLEASSSPNDISSDTSFEPQFAKFYGPSPLYVFMSLRR
jgi:hypothetical protein